MKLITKIVFNSMGAKIGHKKYGGREKGTANKVSDTLKNHITGLLSENWEQFTADIQKLEPIQRVQVYERLLSYVVPKIQSVAPEQNETDNIIIIREV